jgi:MHS family shikimate/dehydroshikimate transporter-like MFS transporter
MSKINRITFASAFGTLFEWYDFLIYGIAAALVFNTLFFPQVDPITGMLASLLTFSVGFIARPVGGILFGHLGDRIGRKKTLMLTMLIMGMATFGIGILPTYQSIGVWAAVLLVVLRLLQGLAFGGEWSGASVMILEHAPLRRRGFYTSFIQMGYPLGLLCATGIYALITRLPEQEFLEWGWRIPFILSMLLVAIGIWVRWGLDETPAFQELSSTGAISKTPLLDVLQQPKDLLIAMGLKITEVSWAYLLTVFAVVYAVNNLSIARSDMMHAILIASVINVIAIPVFGWLSDVVGRRQIYIMGSIITVIIAFPVWQALSSGHLLEAMIAGLVLGNALMMAPLAAYLPELFPASTRYTGSGIGCQMAAALGGGILPVAATALATTYGISTVSILMIVLGLITLYSAYHAPRQIDKS